MKLLLRFNTDGSVTTLYHDAVRDLGLGRIVETERASDVEFDKRTQEWVARRTSRGIYDHDTEIARDPLREEVLRLEREYFQGKIGATWDDRSARWIPYQSPQSLSETGQ